MNNEISQATIMMSQPNVKNIMKHWPLEAMLGLLRGQLILVPKSHEVDMIMDPHILSCFVSQYSNRDKDEVESHSIGYMRVHAWLIACCKAHP